jgi:hypothetical protein
MYLIRKLFAATSLLLLLIIFANPPNSLNAASPTPILYVDSPQGSSYVATSVGENIVIQVKVYTVTNLVACQFKLSFDPTLLTCLSKSTGSLFPPTPYSTVNVDNNQGIISAYLQTSGNPASGSGSLFKFTFNATYGTAYPQPKDTCILQISDDSLYTYAMQSIPHTTLSGTYNSPYASPNVTLTLNMDKNRYLFEEKINVGGSFTGNGYPIKDALVAVEIKNSDGILVAQRTLATSTFQVPCPLRITALAPCTSDGLPQKVFPVGSIAHFNVTVTNTGGAGNLNALIALNPYDSSNASLGVAYWLTTIASGATVSWLPGIPLDNTASSGQAMVYASVLTGFVENGGVAESLESSAEFTISQSSQGSSAHVDLPPQGSYQTLLDFHIGQTPGIFTVYAGVAYMGKHAAQSTQIQMSIGGDINGDGVVDLRDLVLLALAYGSVPGDRRWNPAADINGDGVVGLQDLVWLARDYGK